MPPISNQEGSLLTFFFYNNTKKVQGEDFTILGNSKGPSMLLGAISFCKAIFALVALNTESHGSGVQFTEVPRIVANPVFQKEAHSYLFTRHFAF